MSQHRQQQGLTGTARAGRVLRALAILTFLALALNVLLGKFSHEYGLAVGWNLGNTGEFLLLTLASVLIVGAAICFEAVEDEDTDKTKSNSPETPDITKAPIPLEDR